MADHDEVRLAPELTRVDPEAWVAPGAVVLGDVVVGPRASIWYGSVVRGDCEQIRIGADTNLQDLTIVHADPGFPTLIGERVTIGHRCIVHGARIEDDCLIGMGAILMNGCVIGTGSVIGAGALVTEDTHIPPGSLVLGMPAKVKRAVGDKEREAIRHGAEHYVANARAFKQRFSR